MEIIQVLKKEFSSVKISSYRTKIGNTKSVEYVTESESDILYDNSKILRSEILINFLIYVLKSLRKFKRIFIFEKNK